MILKGLSEHMAIWRFDQGRTAYHQFPVLKHMAQGLIASAGKDPSGTPDPIRSSIQPATGLDFPPADYTGWRNFARTFGLLFLAPPGSTIKPTAVALELVKPNTALPSADEYMQVLLNRWRYPHPAFDSYDPAQVQIFPFAAILKLLCARVMTGSQGRLSVDDICTYLVANDTTGLEDAAYYQNLKPRSFSGDPRQVRELTKFFAQVSFLKWDAPDLLLDTDSGTASSLFAAIQPDTTPPLPDRAPELMARAIVVGVPAVPSVVLLPEEPDQRQFAEGDRKMVAHQRIERSEELRRRFLKTLKKPWRCDMCDEAMSEVYEWADDFIELHHVLPLSSPIKVNERASSLSDLVPLCPNCHRATHAFYRKWLKGKGLPDFRTDAESRACYQEAKSAYEDGDDT